MAAGSPEELQRGLEVKDSLIELTEEEEKIFERLLDVVRRLDLGTTLRVAGGWVRDKLLGEQPNDIDIALDNMTGLEFCLRVNDYNNLVGEKQENPHVIQCNPDRSKHLETAKMSIFDREIDFVNLRSEKYAESNRIPIMENATAKEDAFRRDLTINSLFFNINENRVEDFTERGIHDLKKGLIVTPLHPKTTFLDDPLRVLRAIRFATRFNFTLSDEFKEAASDEEVKLELGRKISRERVGEEIESILSGRRPVEAISYICDLGLFYVAFAFPENSDPPICDKCDRSICYLILVYAGVVFHTLKQLGTLQFLCTTDEQQQLYLYSALFFPLRRMFYLDKKSKKIEVTNYIIKESLKRPSKKNDSLKLSAFAKSVVNIHAVSAKFAELVLLFESNMAPGALKEKLEDAYLDIPTDMLKRVYAGVILGEIKGLWRVALAISVLSYPEAHDKYMKVERSITGLGLDAVWEKPLLDGDDIIGVMDIPEGPLVGEWKERVFKWQLAHPKGSVDDCIDWMKRSQSKNQIHGSQPDDAKKLRKEQSQTKLTGKKVSALSKQRFKEIAK